MIGLNRMLDVTSKKVIKVQFSEEHNLPAILAVCDPHVLDKYLANGQVIYCLFGEGLRGWVTIDLDLTKLQAVPIWKFNLDVACVDFICRHKERELIGRWQ